MCMWTGRSWHSTLCNHVDSLILNSIGMKFWISQSLHWIILRAHLVPFSGVAGRGLGVMSGGSGLAPEKIFVFLPQNNGFFWRFKCFSILCKNALQLKPGKTLPDEKLLKNSHLLQTFLPQTWARLRGIGGTLWRLIFVQTIIISRKSLSQETGCEEGAPSSSNRES